MRTLALAAAFALLVGPAAAETLNVGRAGGYSRLQEAIDLAFPGDVILVAPGIYTWTDQFPNDGTAMFRVESNRPAPLQIISSMGYTIRSEEGPENTIFDAEGEGRILLFGGRRLDQPDHDLLVEGFTFMNGVGPVESFEAGGAVWGHLSRVTFRNCVFVNNRGVDGGAIWWGGVSALSLIDCEFRDNRATRFGGAVLLVNSSERAHIRDSRFDSNFAELGGGAFFNWHVDTLFEDSVFLDNRTNDLGGAVYFGAAYPSIMRRCTFVGNQGARGQHIALRTRPLAPPHDDEGDVPSRAHLENSILARGRGGTSIHRDESSTLTATCNEMYDNQGGNWAGAVAFLDGVDGNFVENPRFCDSQSGDFGLCPSSPARAENNSCGLRLGAAGMDCGDCGEVQGSGTTEAVLMHANSPNPFNPADRQTDINFEITRAGRVRISVYDARGRMVRVLHEEHYASDGIYSSPWDGKDDSSHTVASGVYTVRVELDGEIDARTVVLVR